MPVRTPNILSTNAEALTPLAYKTEEIILTSHDGRSADIKALVTSFEITESIYTPTLTLTMEIGDAVALMEEFQLTGQETIKVTVARQDFGSKERVSLSSLFYVTEYPIYGKFTNRLQVYRLRGVSHHAFLSRFKKVSRAYQDSPLNIIESIAKEELGLGGATPSLLDISKASGKSVGIILPNVQPLEAIAMVLKKTHDETGSPFYFWEGRDGVCRCKSQSELVGTGQVYRTFNDAKYFAEGPGTIKGFDEIQRRLITIHSDVRLSKFISGGSGAFSSTNEVIDLGYKSRTIERFDYLDEFGAMKWSTKNPTLSSSFKVGSDDGELKTLNQFDHAVINYTHTNSLAYNGYTGTFASLSEDKMVNRAAAYLENLDSIVHDITIAGDLRIRTGLMIELDLSKATDPDVPVLDSKAALPGRQKDQFLSGRYLVVSMVHRFEREYTIEARVKKDSLTEKLYTK
jgi:hypothetical protein